MITEPLLAFEGVTKTFATAGTDASVAALGPIDLEVRRNEIVAILGPSGCGKSTLLSIAAGLTLPTKGRAIFAGSEIRDTDPRRGLLFQDYALFPWMTVRENIGFGPSVLGAPARGTKERVAQLIRLVNLSGFETKYPHELSGGMRQRCALARMLANDPAVLLLDEPLSALDAQTKIVLQEELLRIVGDAGGAPSRTVVIVTHSIDEAAFLADRIVVMSRRPGRIRENIIVPFGRPRTREMQKTPAYAELVDGVWRLIAEEVVEAMRE
jgi:NitT/TauT family transport system ATP-binding protein